MTRNIRGFMATGLAIVAFAAVHSSAMAQSYSGNWPITVSKSHHSNTTYCVTLNDDGIFGWPHSGEASLVPLNGTYPGTFQLINGLLMVTIPVPTGTAEPESLLFIAHASNGQIGKGVYEEAYGAEVDSGVLVFGVKGGC